MPDLINNNIVDFVLRLIVGHQHHFRSQKLFVSFFLFFKILKSVLFNCQFKLKIDLHTA